MIIQAGLKLSSMADQLPSAFVVYEFWIKLAGVIVTFLAVLVALFGEVGRRKFFPPKLDLSFYDPKGESTFVRLNRAGNEVLSEPVYLGARFYHLLVRNDRRWSPANQVQIVLLGIEIPKADGEFAPIWNGDVPFGWKNQEFFPASRTVGPDAYIDLCSVREDGTFQIYPAFRPNMLKAEWANESVRLRLSLQARSTEADSNVLRFEISWDGKWEDGADEMLRHLVVNQVVSSSKYKRRFIFGSTSLFF